jgi:hypothetical protein
MKKLALIIRALNKGQQLARVETWKKASVAIAVMSSFLSALSALAVQQGWLTAMLEPELVMAVSSLLVSVVMAVLAYFGVATTEKIGVGGKKKPSVVVTDRMADGMRVSINADAKVRHREQDSSTGPFGY